MKEKIYKEYLSKQQFDNLKASEIREFEKQEESIINLAVAHLLSIFVIFVLLLALILWYNKLTIFLFVIALPIAILFSFSYFKTTSKYKNELKEYKKSEKGDIL